MAKPITSGEPSGGVVACHCLDCQRRSGSVFGVGAYFPRENVSVAGTIREFIRPTEAGNEFCTYFCPSCGTSTHWYTTRSPGLVGGTAAWQLADGLEVQTNDVRSRKRTPDAFLRTPLHELLQERGIGQLIVCGMHSEFCVDTTTRCALALGYPVILVPDGHTSAGNLRRLALRRSSRITTRRSRTSRALDPGSGRPCIRS